MRRNIVRTRRLHNGGFSTVDGTDAEPAFPQGPRERSRAGESYSTTMFTSFLGTTMIFFIFLPAMNGFTLSAASAARSSCS